MATTFADRWEDGRITEDVRREARETEKIFTDAMFAGRRDLAGAERKIRPPPARQRVAMGFGGGTRSTTGDYDWF